MACSDLDYRWGMRTNEWRGLTAGHPRRPDSTTVGAPCFVLGGSGRSPVAGLPRNRTSELDGRRLLESAWRICQHRLIRSRRVEVPPPSAYMARAPVPMTNHQAGADVAEPLGNRSPWRYSGRHYLLAAVPVLIKYLFMLRGRNLARSRASGCASLDQQFDRHEGVWTSVPPERSLHWSPVLLRIRPRNLSQRGECPFVHIANPPRQFTSSAFTTSGSCGRAGVAVAKRDSQVSLSGGQGALALPRLITAMKEAPLHSGLQTAPGLGVRPQVHRPSLRFDVQVDSSIGGNTSFGIINSSSTSRGLAVSLPEIWSAS